MAKIRLSEKMREKQLLSFELFPPKTEKGMENLSVTINKLCELNPIYMSCTYGAGGGNVGANREVCQMIKKAGLVPVTHFNLINNSTEKIQSQLQAYLDEGVDHILALRGDLPAGKATTGGAFNYASELVAYIRETFGDQFEIAVAGTPEGHIDSRSLEEDISYLRLKQDNGADYIMTQLCWDMEQFKLWLDKIDKAGITIPVDVGVMPVTSIKSTIRMALSRNGCVLPARLSRMISKYWIFPDPFDSNPPFEDAERAQKMADFKEAGLEYTIRQIEEYLTLGIHGIHLYTLNKWEDAPRLVRESKMEES